MATKKEIWVADSETDPFELGRVPAPFIWGLYNGVDYFQFDNTDAFVDFVSTKNIICYAHNGGKFDWHFISHRFDPDNPILVIAGRLSRVTIGLCEFRDSINIYNRPLRDFAKDDFDYNMMQPEVRHRYMPEIEKYLKSDCVYLYELVTQFIALFGLHITQATAAMKYWQGRLPSGRNTLPRSDEHFYNDFARFFFGGRVQCFEQGDIKIQAESADINSAYPHAMLEDHPYGTKYVEGTGKPRINHTKWGPMFFDIECVAHGAFCYRGTNGTLYYPDDDIARIYHVTGWELLNAIDTDTAEKIKFLAWFRFVELKTFSEYVNHFWDARKTAVDKHESDFFKRMMNSLYGKFAANPNKYQNNILMDKKEFYEKGIHDLEQGESWHNFREWIIIAKNQDKKSKRFYNVATSASITGYVRAKLWRAIIECDHPMYCDTDSITAVGFNEKKSVTLGDELGEWKIEAKYNRVIICGKKLYAFRKRGNLKGDDKRWKLASKGARLNEKEIIRVAAGKTVIYRSDVPTFSVAKSEPTFMSREIKATAGDSRHIPRRFDPHYVD